MGKVVKRPIVVKDLIELATYIADGNLDISDNFLLAAEKTFGWRSLDIYFVRSPQKLLLCDRQNLDFLLKYR